MDAIPSARHPSPRRRAGVGRPVRLARVLPAGLSLLVAACTVGHPPAQARTPAGTLTPGASSAVTPAGAVTQLALPGAGSNPDGIAAGPAQTVWVTETGADAVVRVTLRGSA